MYIMKFYVIIKEEIFRVEKGMMYIVWIIYGNRKYKNYVCIYIFIFNVFLGEVFVNK